jgi:uncharacterized membrane protein
MVRSLAVRTMSAVQRVVVVVSIAAVVSIATASFVPWQLSPLAGWDAGALWWLVSVWLAVHALTPAETRALSTREDDNRFVAELLLIAASVASLAGTGLVLIKANQTEGSQKALLTAAALVTVFLSWAVVHVVFTLRYTRLYYGDPPGGIDFKNCDDGPDYTDFAYLAFTIGMTYQVSDTDIETRAIRRTVLEHSLLSYLFGAVILAVTVNTIAGVFFK